MKGGMAIFKSFPLS